MSNPNLASLLGTVSCFIQPPRKVFLGLQSEMVSIAAFIANGKMQHQYSIMEGSITSPMLNILILAQGPPPYFDKKLLLLPEPRKLFSQEASDMSH